MDETTKIQLGETQFVNSTNQDTSVKVEIPSTKEALMEYDVKSVVDVTEVFNEERQTTNIYRIYGEIEYLSLLNTLETGYTKIEDFFVRKYASDTQKSIFTDFKFYLLKPVPPSGATLADGVSISNGYNELIEDERYVKRYEVVATPSDIDLVNAGFAKNIFDEQQYTFIVKNDIDTTDVYDALNFPLTELYLYAVYQKTEGKTETLLKKYLDSTGGTAGHLPYTANDLSIGDVIDGDVITYNKSQFTQEVFNPTNFKIYTPLDVTGLTWIYNPIIPIRVRYLSDDLSRVNISGSSVIEIEAKPDYATQIDDEGNFVWRNLVDIGFTDPLTGIGVNHPFINNKHYVFNNIVVSIVPDLDTPNTAAAFSEISFATNTFISSQPASALTDIGKLCQL